MIFQCAIDGGVARQNVPWCRSTSSRTPHHGHGGPIIDPLPDTGVFYSPRKPREYALIPLKRTPGTARGLALRRHATLTVRCRASHELSSQALSEIVEGAGCFAGLATRNRAWTSLRCGVRRHRWLIICVPRERRGRYRGRGRQISCLRVAQNTPNGAFLRRLCASPSKTASQPDHDVALPHRHHFWPNWGRHPSSTPSPQIAPPVTTTAPLAGSWDTTPWSRTPIVGLLNAAERHLPLRTPGCSRSGAARRHCAASTRSTPHGLNAAGEKVRPFAIRELEVPGWMRFLQMTWRGRDTIRCPWTRAGEPARWRVQADAVQRPCRPEQ